MWSYLRLCRMKGSSLNKLYLLIYSSAPSPVVSTLWRQASVSLSTLEQDTESLSVALVWCCPSHFQFPSEKGKPKNRFLLQGLFEYRSEWCVKKRHKPIPLLCNRIICNHLMCSIATLQNYQAAITRCMKCACGTRNPTVAVQHHDGGRSFQSTSLCARCWCLKLATNIWCSFWCVHISTALHLQFKFMCRSGSAEQHLELSAFCSLSRSC